MAFMSKAAAAVIFAVGASGAQAATTHVFDLSKNGPSASDVTANSFTLTSTTPTDGGESLTGTFTGLFMDGLVIGTDGTLLDGTFSAADEATRYNNGMGVCRGGDCLTKYSSSDPSEPHTVDGVTDGIFDYIEMAFRVGGDLADVTLSKLRFGWIGEWTYGGKKYGYPDTDGAFEIVLDALDDAGSEGIGVGDVISYSGTVIPKDNFNSRGSVDLSGASLLDSIFGVKAGEDGSWKLLSVTVEYDGTSLEPPDTPPPPVPLPGAVWFLLAGLGGLAIAKRSGHS